MKKYIILFVSLFSMSALACPEFNGVDMADGETEPVYVESSQSPINITEQEFYSMPQWADSNAYEDCKDAMKIHSIKHKKTGRIFNAVLSHKDECDGGNSVGALYSENMLVRVADIGDSFISCY